MLLYCVCRMRICSRTICTAPCTALCCTPVQVYIDGVLRVPYDNLLKVNQVRPELQVVDPGDA